MNKEVVLPQTVCECGLVGNEYCAGCEARLAQRDADWERVSPLLELLSKLAEAAKRPIDDAYRGKVESEVYTYDHRPYHALGVLIVRAEEALVQLGMERKS